MNRISEIDGLRGLAALLVCCSHIQLAFWNAAPADIANAAGPHASRLIMALLDGEFYVWLFWVMSAVVLSIRFHQTAQQEANTILTDSAIRRLPRLWFPVAITSLVSYALLASGLQDNHRLADELGAAPDTWIRYWNNFTPSLSGITKFIFVEAFFDYDAPTTYNNVLWTMQIELEGSLFLFALLALFGKTGFRYWIYLAAIIILSVKGCHWLTSFVVGAMICDLYINKPLQHRSFLKSFSEQIQSSTTFLLFSSLAIAYTIGLPNYFGVANLVISSLVTVLALQSHSAKRILRGNFFQFLGRISFGLYLIHVPVLFTFGTPILVFLESVLPRQGVIPASMLTLLVLSVLFGWLTWLIADRPSANFSRLISNLLYQSQYRAIKPTQSLG
jgi:peptidoglycan/LPS O-acetylase OafA/YrhL